MKKYISIGLMALLCQIVNAQVTGEVNVLDRDVFYIQHLAKSEVAEHINYQKWSGKFSLPPIRIKKVSMYNTFGLDAHQFNFDKAFTTYNPEQLERFYNVNYNVFMNYKISETWSLNGLIMPYVLTRSDANLEFDDFNMNGNVYIEHTFLKENGGYIQVGLGVGYMTLNGVTQLTPISQIKARLNKKWSFVLGLPNTYIKWDINKKHTLKLLGDLNDLKVNLSDNNALVDRLVFTTISPGLEYNYWVSPSFGILLKGTYPIWSNYELRDSDNEPTFDFDPSSTLPLLSVGVKFNPIRNIQNKLR